MPNLRAQTVATGEMIRAIEIDRPPTKAYFRANALEKCCSSLKIGALVITLRWI